MSEPDFQDLFGSEDEASDIDDGRSQTPTDGEQQQSPPTTAAPTNNTEHDLEDLFGESESETEDQPKRKLSAQKRSRVEEDTDDESEESASRRDLRLSNSQEMLIDEEDETGSAIYQEDDNIYSDQARKKKRVEIELTMPQLPVPYSDNDKFYLAKLPRYLDIDTNPFDPDEFEVQVPDGLSEKQKQGAIREQIENTIRWRRVKDEDGLDTMQSNAHLVEWDDGRVSLMLGNECFDVASKPMGPQEHTFLLAHQTSAGALESHAEFTDHMTFKPSSLKSDTHRYLTAQIADRQVKKNRTKMFFTEKDPELIKQQLEMQEQERLKAQRKLEMQRKKADLRYSSSAAGSARRADSYIDEYDSAALSRGVGGSHNRALDRYEDDFVVDDDDYEEEEEEERRREERLAKAKRAGMENYKRRYDEVVDEDEEEEEIEEADYGVDDEDEDDEVVVKRPNRQRHVFSDEDE